MPIAGNVTLNTKVYSPRGTSNGVTKWVKPGDTGFGGGQSELTSSLKGPNDSGNNRVRIILTSPLIASEDSVCACAGTALGIAQMNCNIDLPSALTPAQRQDFRMRIKDYFATAEFTALLDNLEGSWG